MSLQLRRFSLFSQPLDRTAFVAYFLGAVVPLAVLAFFARRYVYPGLEGPLAGWGLVAMLVSIAVLSLASYLALRRVTRQALARRDLENRRLGSLLASSHSIAAAGDDREVMRVAAVAAAEITCSPAAFFLGREKDGQLRLLESSSPQAAGLFAGRRQSLEQAAEEALSTLRPTERPGPGPRGGMAYALPCGRGRALAGVLAVWQESPGPDTAAERDALATLAALTTVALRSADLQESQRNFFTHVTNLLVSALDAHLVHQTEHSRRVAQLANEIGRALELPGESLHRLHFSALLHDIGMLKIDREQLLEGRTAARQHAELGFQMLSQIQLWEDLAPIVHHHHEWFDGNGYPTGLKGEEIPLESRIIAVAETFDSLTAAQSYRKPVSVEEALSRLEGAAGSQFDPQVVRVLVALKSEAAAEVGG